MGTHAVVLYSGGPDSFITWQWAKQQDYLSLTSCYVQLGHRYQPEEIRAVTDTVPATFIEKVVQGMGVWEEDDAHIFGRNAFLCLVAARLLPQGVDGEVLLTVQEDELLIPDRKPKFLKQMSILLTMLREFPTTVYSPWLQMDKTDMVEWYLKEGVPEELKRTHSCYSAHRVEGKQCGDCAACFRRAVAFGLNGIAEEYTVDPFSSATALRYGRRALAGAYSEKRKGRILMAMGGL